MLDAPARRLVAPALDAVSRPLARAGVPAGGVTAVGWLLGLAACAAVLTEQWAAALVLWLANRAADGLDGALARRRGPTDLGGFLDVMADFSVYAGFVAALAVVRPDARLACVALLTTYYLSGVAFLALAPMLERRGGVGDGRSILFVGGLAEGTETLLAYVAFCLLPGHTATVAWVFAAMVAVTALQRVGLGVRALRAGAAPGSIRDGAPPRTTSGPDPHAPAEETR